MSRYIRKKKLDPLEFYVPVVLEAREQLQEAGKVMLEQPAAARDLLRKGAFDGLRENVRALGEYAVINGQQAAAGTLVAGFFKALETFDQVLADSVKNDVPVPEASAQAGLDETTAALDALLATVPPAILDQSKRVVEIAREKDLAAAEALTYAAEAVPGPGAPDASDLEGLLPQSSP